LPSNVARVLAIAPDSSACSRAPMPLAWATANYASTCQERPRSIVNYVFDSLAGPR
jgi:hypothetical protein